MNDTLEFENVIKYSSVLMVKKWYPDMVHFADSHIGRAQYNYTGFQFS